MQYCHRRPWFQPPQGRLDLDDRVAPVLSGIARGRGPGAEETRELAQRPMVLERFPVELVQYRLECGLFDTGIAVPPYRNHAAGDKHSLRFPEERIDVEPVKRLRGGHEIDRSIGKSAFFRRRAAVVHVRGGSRVLELLAASISGDYAVEVACKSHRCLPIAGAAVEGKAAARWKAGDLPCTLIFSEGWGRTMSIS